MFQCDDPPAPSPHPPPPAPTHPADQGWRSISEHAQARRRGLAACVEPGNEALGHPRGDHGCRWETALKRAAIRSRRQSERVLWPTFSDRKPAPIALRGRHPLRKKSAPKSIPFFGSEKGAAKHIGFCFRGRIPAPEKKSGAAAPPRVALPVAKVFRVFVTAFATQRSRDLSRPRRWWFLFS